MKKILFLFTCLTTISIFSYSQDSLNYYLDLAAKNNPAVLQKLAEYTVIGEEGRKRTG